MSETHKARTLEDLLTPISRFNSLILSLTVFIMFILIPMVYPLIDTYLTPQWVLFHLGRIGSQIYASILGVVGGFGVYSFLLWLLDLLISRVRLVKKFVLGPSYLEGTWVGYYGAPMERFLAIDVYEQTLSNTSIKGNGYRILPSGDTEERAHWNSQMVHIDPAAGTLDFYCKVDLLPKETTDSITKFQLFRPHSSLPPTQLIGDSANMKDGVKLPIQMFKLTEDTTYDEKIAVDAAKRYLNNRSS